jgi:hypothetical protein
MTGRGEKTTQPNPNTSQTYLESIVNKYLDYLNKLKNPNSNLPADTLQNQSTNPTNPFLSPAAYSTANPYLSPAAGGGYGGGSGGAGGSGGVPFGGSPMGNFMSGLQKSLGGYNGSAIAGDINNSGQINGTAASLGQGVASSFAHDTFANGCSADKDDQQNGQQSSSGQILSRAGMPAIPAVALRISGKSGTAVEVKDLSTGNCKAFPLLDFGPAPCKVNGTCTGGQGKVVIDLTGSAIDILKGSKPCKTVTGPPRPTKSGIPRVQYAIVPGEKIKPGEVKDCKNLTK